MEPATQVDAAAPFVGRWRRLVSTTNWEKGRIICEWRSALIECGAAPPDYTDEAWAREVGAVSPGHVGRLRRVYERFGSVHAAYRGLFWSHFQAALDWNDAEMWLEGAVQNGWSVAAMRARRSEVLGAVAGDDLDDEPAEAELDEDAEPPDGPPVALAAAIDTVRPTGDLDEPEPNDADELDSVHSRAEPLRTLADLPSLPPDLTEAFETYKLCILRHKLALWREVSRDDVLATLDALRELALAPAI